MPVAFASAAVLLGTRPCVARGDDERIGGGSVSADYVGPTEGYTRKVPIHVEQLPLLSGIVVAGPIDYQFHGPAEGEGRSLVGAMLPTFGVEAEGVLSPERRYALREVRHGPEPIVNNLSSASRYGERGAALVHAVVGAAIRLRWLRSDGTLGDSGNVDTNCDRMAAMQLLVWESVLETRELPERWSMEDGTFTASLVDNPGVARELATLKRQAIAHLEGNLLVEGLRTMTSRDSQDRLVIVRPRERARVAVDRVRRLGGVDAEEESHVRGNVPGSPQPYGGFVAPVPPPPPPPNVPLPRSALSGLVGLALVGLLWRRKFRL